jgi:hypothetical protein
MKPPYVSAVRASFRQRRARISRDAFAVATVLAVVHLLGCVYSSFSPIERGQRMSPTRTPPVFVAGTNPLDASERVEVACGPQGAPVVESKEVVDCKLNNDCKVVCTD